MSEYGSDANPDIPKAQELAYTFGLLPHDGSNVMQWTLSGNRVVRKLAQRKDKSNILFLIQE